MQRPSSMKNASASFPKTPMVSMATGTKWCVAANSAYLSFFFRSAWSTTAPASRTASCKWDGAKVSGQVVSQTSTRPLFHGIIVAPSGLFPSNRHIPAGSKCAETLADARDLLMMSLKNAWFCRIEEVMYKMHAYYMYITTITTYSHSCFLGRHAYGCQKINVFW